MFRMHNGHGYLADDHPNFHEARQLAGALRNTGVRFKLHDREMSKEGAPLIGKLNRFLRLLDEAKIEAHLN